MPLLLLQRSTTKDRPPFPRACCRVCTYVRTCNAEQRYKNKRISPLLLSPRQPNDRPTGLVCCILSPSVSSCPYSTLFIQQYMGSSGSKNEGKGERKRKKGNNPSMTPATTTTTTATTTTTERVGGRTCGTPQYTNTRWSRVESSRVEQSRTDARSCKGGKEATAAEYKKTNNQRRDTRMRNDNEIVKRRSS